MRDVEFSLSAVRLALHVLSVCVWVGGQIVVGAVVPLVAKAFPGSGAVAARAFSRVAWPAFGVAVLTGMWGMLAAGDTTSAWSAVLGVKMLIVLVSGVAALVHQNAGDNATKRGISAGISLLTALAALFLGVALGGSA